MVRRRSQSLLRDHHYLACLLLPSLLLSPIPFTHSRHHHDSFLPTHQERLHHSSKCCHSRHHPFSLLSFYCSMDHACISHPAVKGWLDRDGCLQCPCFRHTKTLLFTARQASLKFLDIFGHMVLLAKEP